MAANLSALLEKLHISNESIPVLQELKAAIQTIHPTHLPNLVSPLSFVPVFDRLNSSSGEEIGLCCDILSYMMDSMTPGMVATELSQQLNKALHHPNMNINLLALKQLSRCVSEHDVECVSSSTNPSYIGSLINLLAHGELKIVALVTELLTNIGRYNMSRQHLLSDPSHVASMEGVMAISDTIRYRVYDVIVGISCIDSGALSDVNHHTRILSSLMSELSGVSDGSGDALVQLNAIHMITTLVSTVHGLVYADECGVLSTLHSLLVKYDEHAAVNPLASLLLPGIIQLFGHASSLDPALVTSRYSGYLPSVFRLLSPPLTDEGLTMVALETVALFGSSTPGKETLIDKYGSEMTQHVMPCIGQCITTGGDTQVRVRALQALASLITNTAGTGTDQAGAESRVSEATLQWFRAVEPLGHESHSTINLILSLCRQPFHDVRTAALYVVNALATHSWGQQQMSSCAGLIEHVLDRGTESGSKAGKEAKYSIVSTLLTSPTSSHDSLQNIFGNSVYLRLKAYHKQGAFYVDVTTEIATEDME